MAEVLEVEDGSDIGELETVEQQVQQQPAEESKPNVNDVIPEKYRGKSLEDLVKMHQDTERNLSRQGNELGEIRKLADELLRSQLAASKPKEVEQPKEVDFFENPQEAINRAVETNPAVLEARQYAIQAKQAQAKQQLAQMHPDFQQIIADQEFAEWIGKSQVRQNLLRQADAYDLAAANELLSTFKELRSVKQQQVTKVEDKAREATLKAAAVDTGGSGESGKKVYRRADLIRLRIRDPDRYDAMQHEIMAAYQEGRVR